MTRASRCPRDPAMTHRSPRTCQSARWAVEPCEPAGAAASRREQRGRACRRRSRPGAPPCGRTHRARKRRSALPRQQVRRPGVADDAAGIVRCALRHTRADERVEAVTVGVGQDPRVSPGLVVPGIEVQLLVPAWVGLADGVAWVLGPGHEVGRGGESAHAGPVRARRRDARVGQVPGTAVSDDGAGPGRDVVPGARRPRLECVGQHTPVAQVGRDRVPDGGVDVALRTGSPKARGAWR